MSGYTEADLTKLQAALASGVRVVRFEDGRQVEYQSLADLVRAIGIVQGALATAVGARVTHVNPTYNKGV